MADDQETSNDMGDENPADDYGDADGNDINDGNDPIAPITTTEIPPPPPPTPPPYEPYNNDDGGNNVQNDYDDDEPLPDVTVKLFINGDGSDTDNINGLVTDIVDGRITDEIGKFGPTTTPSLQEGIESYTSAITQGIFDEVNANGTDVGGKRWWGKFINNKKPFLRRIEYLKYVCLGV